MPSLIDRPKWTVFVLFILLMCFTTKPGLAAEVHHVRGLVGEHARIPCLLSTDRLSMIDHQASYYDDNLNRTYDSIRLILFYKESIKSPIYSIDNRNTQSLRLAKHFAAETFHSRLSIEDNLDLNNTSSNYPQQKHQAKVELVGGQPLTDSNSNESGLSISKNGQSNFVPSAGSTSTGIQLLGFNVPLETPHHYHHYQQQLEQLEKQKQNSKDHDLDTIYLRIDKLKSTDSGDYKCRVDFRRGRTLTTHASLKVIVPPTDVHISNLDSDKLNSESNSVDELSEAKFVCLASSATPVPYFSWQLNNQPIPQHLSTSLSLLWQQQKQKQEQVSKSLISKSKSIASLTSHRQQTAIQIRQDDQSNNDLKLKELKDNKDKRKKSSKMRNNNDTTRNQDDNRTQTSLQSSTFATVNYISPAELTTTTGSVLLLRNLTRADIDSVLSCSASHPLYPHSINGSIKLDINLKPATIELEKAKKALISGKIAQFSCSTSGSNPPALITWYLNDQQLNGAKETVCTNGNCTNSQLNLQLTPEHDQQNLKCQARNTRFIRGDFSLEASSQLNVFYEPIVNLTVASSMMTEGEELILTCQAVCRPSAISFSWLFNNKIIDLQNKEINNQGNSSTLRIKSLSRDNQGRYQCLARNLIGEQASQPIDVQVNFAPRCKSNQKFVYGADLEEKIRILCDVDAQPVPTRFHWSLQSNHSSVRQPLQQFHASGSRSSAVFTPTTRDQLGDVFCAAENSAGVQVNPCIFHIIPAGRPDSLQNCALVSVDSDSIQVGCESSYDGGLSQIFHLEVYLKKHAALHKHQPPINNSINYLNSTINTSSSSLSAVFDNSSSPVSSSSVTSASRKSLYEGDAEHVLVQNLTNPLEPRFYANKLSPGNSYYFVLYSSNLKGRSRKPLELNARTSVGHSRNHSLGTFVSVAPPFASIPLSVFKNFTSTHLSYLLALSCIFLLILLFKVRASKQPIQLVRENSDDSSTGLDSSLIEHKNKHSLDFGSVKRKADKNWILNDQAPPTRDFDLENNNPSKCPGQSALLNNDGTHLAVMLDDNEIMTQSTNATYNYLQQLSHLGQLSASDQQQLFLQQQPPLLVETKNSDLLDHLYRSNEFQLIESKKLFQDNDPHNLLIISKGDQLDQHEQSFKEAITNDPLLPLHTNLPLLNNQNESLLTSGNQLQLDVLNKQTEQFTYDTLKQLQYEQNYLLPSALQSTLEENLVNLMNGSIVNSGNLSRPQFNTFGSPYIPKSALDNNRIIYSTIANTVNDQVELSDSISLANNSTIQLTDNQSCMLTNAQENDLIEMSINRSSEFASMTMDDKSSEQLPFVSNV